MSILKVENLEKTFGRRRVVDGVSLTVQRGEIVGLLGPNGAGKSTTFKMICGLLNPDRGNVTLAGKDVTKWPMYERARNGGMGYLPQQSSIFGKLTVQQNLLMVMQLLKMSRKEQKARCDELLEQFKIEKLRKSKASKLSGGERRRLEIARCLVSNPEIIMLDEPFAGIDPVTVQSIRGVIEDLRDSGIAILITDHAATQVLETTDRTYVVSEGRILCSGTAEEIVQHDEVKRKYLGEIEFSKSNTNRSKKPRLVDSESEQSVQSQVDADDESLADDGAHNLKLVGQAMDEVAASKAVKIQLPVPSAPDESQPSISFGAGELTGAIKEQSASNEKQATAKKADRVARRKATTKQMPASKIPSPFAEVQDEISISSASRSSGNNTQPPATPVSDSKPTVSRKRTSSVVPPGKVVADKANRIEAGAVVEVTKAENNETVQITKDGRRRIFLESDPDPNEEVAASVASQVVRKPAVVDLNDAKSNLAITESKPSSPAAGNEAIAFQEVAEAVDEMSESAEEAAKRVRSAIKRPKINKVAQFRKLKAPFSSDDVK